jgi:ABC-2 type transport system permease protein
MRAEFEKVRSMPTPFWCAFAALIFFLGGIVGCFIWGIGEEAAALELGVGIPTSIIAIVFGVWLFGVEYGQNTLRRTLTADPRRGHLIIFKLLVLLVVITLVTVVLHLLAFVFYNLAASGHDGSLSAETVFRYGAASLLNNVVNGIVGMAFALITASMAGGMTIALVFIFILDEIISIIPGVGDYTMGLALIDISNSLRGFSGDFFGESISIGRSWEAASLIVVAWLLGLMLLGALRFTKSDVK